MKKIEKGATTDVANEKRTIAEWRDVPEWKLEQKFSELGTIKSLRLTTNSLKELAESYEKKCNEVKSATEINIDELEQHISILNQAYKILGNKIKQEGYDLDELSVAIGGLKNLAEWFDEIVTKIEKADEDEEKIDMAVDIYSDNKILESIVRWLDNILCQIVERENIN